MAETVFQGLHRVYPDRITNKTNGITVRRWLMQANPGLAALPPRRSARAGSPTRSGWPASSRCWTTRPSATATRRSSGATRRGSPASSSTGSGSWSTRPPCSTSRSSASTSTSASSSTSWRRSRSTTRCAPTRSGPWVPRVKVFAGKAAASYHRAKLIIQLINDVARVVNRDPLSRDRLQVVVPAELQRQPRRDHHPGGRPVRADPHRRHGGLGHRQHEVRAQRCGHDRHARRRQHRDPGAGRRRQHPDLRPHRRAGRQGAADRLRLARRGRGGAGARARRWPRSARACSRPRTRAATPGSWTICCTTTISW